MPDNLRIYPALYSLEDDGSILITFPDLPGCISQADTPEEALYMARDALGCWISAKEEVDSPVPAPSDIRSIEKKDGQSLVMVDVWMPLYREERIRGSVKKNGTIPLWLNNAAEKANLNFSKILQAGLKASLGLQA